MKNLLFLLSFSIGCLFASAQSFTYDNANRLTQITYGNGLTISYSYDKLGNRIGQTINGSPLPLALNSFTASANKCEVSIHWQSGVQSDILSFILERSEDGNSFKSIATIAVKADGRYEYNDMGNGNKYQYYRLRILNKDNSYQYSQTLSVFTDCMNPAQFSVYPNPTKDNITVKFTASVNQTYQLTLYDVQGRKISFKEMKATQKENMVLYSLNGLTPSIYYLKLMSGNETVGVEKIENR